MNPLIIMAVVCGSFQASFGALSVEMTNNTSCPCHEESDHIFHGILLNCQYQTIHSLPLLTDCIPKGVTTLLLDHNFITLLSNASFTPSDNWRSVRFLGLSNNNISRIAPYSFYEFNFLQVINLRNNIINLDDRKLDGRAFFGLGSLKELDLTLNGNKDRNGKYPDILFRDLHQLVTLGLDTFYGELNFGSLFQNTRQLYNLSLTGGMTVIKNDSFENFTSIRLKKLIVTRAMQLYYTEPGAFRFLSHLDWYELAHVNQFIKETLESLAPFEKRNMSRLIFNRLGNGFHISIKHDSTITKSLARFLSKICVENFALRQSNLIFMEIGVFSNALWRKCLTSIDISKNPIRGMTFELTRLASAPNMEYFAFTGGKYGVMASRVNVWRPPSCNANINSNSCDKTAMEISKITLRNEQYGINDIRLPRDVWETTNETVKHLHNMSAQRKRTIFTSSSRHEVQSYGKEVSYFSEKLRIIILNGMSTRALRFNKPTKVREANKLVELHISDNGIRDFIIPVDGIAHIRLLDISKNDGSTMSDKFFKKMPSIAHLNMAQMNLQGNFMAINSSNLFKNLPELMTLDLSNNDLQFLSKKTFAFNSKLSVLLLAENRFNDLPFDIDLVPNLCLLDLRKNSILELSEEVIKRLERHAILKRQFLLSLDGNNFYCGCKNLRFLSWLQRTKIHLDNNGDYVCTSDAGRPTTTSQRDDLNAMWRICQGQNAFWISILLICFMVFGFLTAIMISKFKSQLKVFIAKVFWTPFVTKTSADYPIGVFIGYADQETNLACQRLRPFIEQTLHLSTYVRHRDQLPGPIISDSIMEAVHFSWRVLLIVSENFLNDPWSYFLTKASTYAVQSDNPVRIVLVLVTDNDHVTLLSRLPNCLLQIVEEENIVSVTTQWNFSDDDIEALETALL